MIFLAFSFFNRNTLSSCLEAAFAAVADKSIVVEAFEPIGREVIARAEKYL